MAVYQLGQSITWAISVVDENNQPANVGGGVSGTVLLPDGSETTCPVSNPSVGQYEATLAASTLLGRHICLWEGTGANSGGLPYTDHADVLDLSRLIVPLATARTALNLPATMTTGDDELRLHIAAATTVIEARIGPVLPATETERRSGSGLMALPLYQAAETVKSVVEDGVTLTSTDWCLDEHSILWRGPRPGAGAWSTRGAANVTVTYTVGSPVVDPAVLLAASILVQHMWRTQTSTRPALGATSPDVTAVAGYLVPNRVLELLAAVPDRRMPGFA